MAANRNVRRLEAAWALGLIGGWVYSIAIAFFAYEVGGPALVGVAMAVRMVPAAIAGPFAATLADRFPRHKFLVAVNLGQAAAIGSLSAAVALDAGTTVVLALAAVFTIVSVAFYPTFAALLPRLVRRPQELTTANAVASGVESVSIFAGPALGGVVLAATSPAGVSALAATLLLAGAWFAARIQPPVDAPTDDEAEGGTEQPVGVIAQVADGFRALVANRPARLLVALMVAQTLVDGALAVLVVITALELLDMGEAGIGWLNSAVGVGALVGAVLAAALLGRRLAATFGVGMVLWGVPIAVLGVWGTPALALVLLGVLGIGNALIDVSAQTLLQRSIPDRVLARVFGILEGLIYASLALGALIAPLLIELLGIRGALVATGAFLPLVAALAWPRLRRLDAEAFIPTAALTLLRGVPLLAPLPGPRLEELASRSGRVRIAAGEDVFRQGDPGDRFYVIESGEVEVVIDGSRARTEGPGEHFGEIALVRDVPRTGTVRALADTELLALDRNEFLAAVTGYAESREQADTVVGERLAHMRPALAAL